MVFQTLKKCDFQKNGKNEQKSMKIRKKLFSTHVSMLTFSAPFAFWKGAAEFSTIKMIVFKWNFQLLLLNSKMVKKIGDFSIKRWEF